jgi:acetoin utilization deacetylase AcuC-like enzyme
VSAPAAVAERLVMVEQRQGSDDAALWVREGSDRIAGQDSNLRLAALRDGLLRHPRVTARAADADDRTVERTLATLHESRYLEALAAVNGDPVVMPDFAPPGLEPDIPVNAPLVAAAREAVRTAIGAAECLLDGERFAYAVCRPPGHHAGPAFQAGYCYLNNAAAAARRLCEGGLAPVGIVDLDLHYPNGTSALVERMPGEAILHSLHAAPVTNLPPGATLPRLQDERVVAFAASPSPEEYLAELRASVEALRECTAALVVSLGYDTVAGDPHGNWSFDPPLFGAVGEVLATAGRPVCVIQEGGYALEHLAACSHAFASGLLGAADGTETGPCQRKSSRRRTLEGEA